MRGRGSLKVLTVRGIDIEVHVSLLFLLFYLVFVIAARLPAVAQEARIDVASLTPGPLAWGFIMAIAIFVSVALHEFGHAFVGQSLGVRVRGITLMMLGGVSQMDRMPDRRYGEFKLAIIGPLVSLAIGAGLLGLRQAGLGPDLSFFCYWVGTANIALALFNLLPAFPLDGGRALRSVLAARQGEVRATQNSVRISRVFAWALGLVGLLGFNILLMIIAFFIYTAAQAELFVLMSRGLLQGLTAGEVAVRAETLSAKDTLLTAAERMRLTRNTVLPAITERGAPAIVALSEIRRVPRDFWHVTLVRDVLDESPRSLHPNEPIAEAFTELAGTPRQALPLVEGGRIIGVVRYADIQELLQLRSLEERAGERAEPPRKAA
jgi:Zn-dependent protease